MLSSLDHHELLVFWAELLVIYATARILGAGARRLGLPSVVGELSAGVMLGPSLFGSVWEGGFDWFLPGSEVQSALLLAVSWFSAAFLLVLIVTNVMLTRIVLRPVARMSEVAEKVSLGDFSVPEYTKPGKDEISSLSGSFNRMRRSIESAMKLIDE